MHDQYPVHGLGANNLHAVDFNGSLVTLDGADLPVGSSNAVGFDFTGKDQSQVDFRNVCIEAQGIDTNAAILIARSDTPRPTPFLTLMNVVIDGHFKDTSLVMASSEANSFRGCEFNNETGVESCSLASTKMNQIRRVRMQR